MERAMRTWKRWVTVVAVVATALLALLAPRGAAAQQAFASVARPVVAGPALESGAARATAVWELADVTTPPRVWSVIDAARSIARHYPAEARRMERRGRVVVEMIVGADGQVEPESILVVHSSSADFDLAAKSVAAELRFTPARHERGVVRARVMVPVAFEP